MKALRRNSIIMFRWNDGLQSRPAPDGMSLTEASYIAVRIQTTTHNRPGANKIRGELLDHELTNWEASR